MMKQDCVKMLFLVFFLVSCASPKKTTLSGDPKAEIKTIETTMLELQKRHVDLMGHEYYEEGVESFEEAKKDLAKNEETSDVLEELAEAKRYLSKAEKEASEAKTNPKRLLKARSKVLETKFRESENLVESLKDIDEDLRDETDTFKKDLSPEMFASFQRRYLQLEVKAIQFANVGDFEKIIDKAVKNDAENIAPQTLKGARTDLNAAKNMIEQNPRTPKYFESSVMEANKSAKLLDDVMNKLLGEAKGASEKVALTLVHQERKLGTLSETVGSLEGELASNKKNLEETKKKLSSKESSLLSKEAQLRFQEAMNSVRNNFSAEEASVYQQGERLILRLRKLNFPSGSSKIPTSSLPLLAKISGIVKNLEPENVVIQGHTDSNGSGDFNQKLSMDRARAVSTYLASTVGESQLGIETQGLGESEPIANNETKEGRALNRRVDIVIDAK